MFLDVLEENKGKRVILATVAEGSALGYRCIMADDEVVFESGSIEPALCEEIQAEMRKADRTCYREIGTEKVFFEIISQRSQLVICGGGHVALSILKLAKFLHLPVTVLEDRPMFANQAREAQADKVICDSFEHGLESIEGDLDTYFVVVTRGHRYDKVCLESILKKKYAYLGMMGSRSRVKMLKKVMIEEGWPEEKLEELHSPIGLNINSETPEEIAVSILGEIISVKNARKRSEGFTDEVTAGIRTAGKKALATIVMRKGSAPRQIGTKMVVFPDGTAKGTVGGGCAEAELMRVARSMMMKENPTPEVVRLNLLNEQAEDEGMVCGGIQDVYLEIVE